MNLAVKKSHSESEASTYRFKRVERLLCRLQIKPKRCSARCADTAICYRGI